MIIKNLANRFQKEFPPLQKLLIFGFLVRLVSVFFSKGYGWHDDHFLIIECAQSWIDGAPQEWLPNLSDPNSKPGPLLLSYMGLHALLFWFFKLIHVFDPQLKMLIVRFLHACWSLLIILFGYKIALHYSNKRTAWYTGLFLALFWFMPNVSVRNLSELVCVPPMLGCVWFLIKPGKKIQNYWIAGLLLALGFSFRFQTLFLIAGIGISLLMMKTPLKQLLVFILSSIFFSFIFSGLIDVFIWGYPFAEFLAYLEYNFSFHAMDNASSNWHMYFDLLLGLPLPPLSIVIFIGFFKVFRRISLLTLPVILYLGFHTYFINRQERFIFTILPFYLIAGTIGAFELYDRYKDRFKPSLIRGSRIFVVTVNILLLIFIAPSYSKRNRVESVYYLRNTGDCPNFIVDQSNKENSFIQLPLFYFGTFPTIMNITKKFTAEQAFKIIQGNGIAPKPNYIIFMDPDDLDNRVKQVKKWFPEMYYITTIQPGFLDRLIYWMNPSNESKPFYIYRLYKEKG